MSTATLWPHDQTNQSHAFLLCHDSPHPGAPMAMATALVPLRGERVMISLLIFLWGAWQNSNWSLFPTPSHPPLTFKAHVWMRPGQCNFVNLLYHLVICLLWLFLSYSTVLSYMTRVISEYKSCLFFIC